MKASIEPARAVNLRQLRYLRRVHQQTHLHHRLRKPVLHPQATSTVVPRHNRLICWAIATRVAQIKKKLSMRSLYMTAAVMHAHRDLETRGVVVTVFL